MPERLWVKNIGQLVTVCDKNQKFIAGTESKKAAVLNKDEEGPFPNMLNMFVDSSGNIERICHDNELISGCKIDISTTKIIDAEGKCIIPGFVDAHTHSVWDGDRVHEFAMKLAGAGYMEIMEMGGGIHFTVRKTKEASQEKLEELLEKRLAQMLNYGSTCVEVKSGYGLEIETELKMLRVIHEVKKRVKQTVTSTYLGPHAVPRGISAEDQTQSIIKTHLPALKTALDNEEISLDQLDAFTETGVFTVDQTERIMNAALELGLDQTLNIHVEELSCLGGAEMVAKLKQGRAASHLEEVSDEGIKQMAENNIAAVLLPTTALQLKLKPPPTRKMIDAGCIIALGSDFNPNAHCLNMPLVLYFGCTIYGLTMDEALVAATINSAYALGKSEVLGSLEVGKQADFLVLDANSWEHVIYQVGSSGDVIERVFVKGQQVK